MTKEKKINYSPIVTIIRKSDNQTITVDLSDKKATELISAFGTNDTLYLNNFKNEIKND